MTSAQMVKIQGVVQAENMPEVLREHPELKGVFIGGCVDRGVGSSFRAQAHAHTSGKNKGWICIRGWRRLYQRQLLLHELAHILTGQGHTDVWRTRLRQLGGRVPARYRKRKVSKRTPCACGSHKFGNEGASWYAADNRWHSWKRCWLAANVNPAVSPSTIARAAACRSSQSTDMERSPTNVQGEAMHHFIHTLLGGTQ